MTELLTAAQMMAIEQASMAAGTVSGLELMERAGQGVVAALLAQWPGLAVAPHRAVVLCGPGNNGGDGFVIARLLKERDWQVDAILYGDPARLPPDARTNHDRWAGVGPVTVRAIDAAPMPDDSPVVDGKIDLLVDALFGTGLGRPLAGPFTWVARPDLWDGMRAGGTRVLAVDLPSGLCSDSGRVLGAAIPADLTVSFHSAKLGHVLGAGPAMCGRTVVAGIGLARDPAPAASIVRAVDAPAAASLSKQGGDHKYGHGHALVLSGPMGRSGAARLAARGALRVGAGLVTVAAPGSAMLECATQLTAVMLRRCNEAEDLTGLLADARFTALCLGPGLGTGAGTRSLVAAALAAGCALVLDADALTAFADAPETLFEALRRDVVLTPHGGEFARLFPDLAETLAAPATRGPAYSKVDATREAAARAGCTVLFKGSDTVIASPDGRCAVHAAAYDRAAPWLATAGSGDVLAGIITGLLARGLAPQEAAETGAWLHTEAARAFGPGLIAEDLPEMLPQVFRDLGL